MLVALYGSNQACLASVPNPAITYAGDAGLTAGAEAVQQLILEHRPAFQNSLDPFIGGLGPGEWRPTPGVTAGANTFFVFTKPFTLNSTRQFRPPPPPPLQSEIYRREYDEVKALGSLTGSTRTAAQTDVARFWTTPPAQLFGAVRSLATANVTDVGESARLFALVALAAADSQLTVFESKYHYNFWRPITAIQQGDVDNNPNTVGDPSWTPFLTTPPYPDYSSGANGLSGSMTTALQLFFGTDELGFTSSNVIGGVVVTRSYKRISELALEVVEARILQGIHFRSADEAARVQGGRVAHWIFQRFLRPVTGK
jgi:hypothetical protein